MVKYSEDSGKWKKENKNHPLTLTPQKTQLTFFIPPFFLILLTIAEIIMINNH